jgi:ankyrin repeat protein
VAKLLLENGADISTTDTRKETALHLATKRGNETLIRLLLDKGADVLANDHYGGTALSNAVEGGNEGIVRLLLENGTDVQAAPKPNTDGCTPIYTCLYGEYSRDPGCSLIRTPPKNIRERKKRRS